MDNDRNNSVKIIRVVSCLMILLTHFGSFLFPIAFLSTFFTYCAEGVRAFFILSGYLMCFSKDLRDGRIIGYYKKRLRRILPFYYFIIIIFVILGIVNIIPWPFDETGLYFLRYFLLVSTSVPSNEVYWTNLAMTWTVSCFLCFYLIAPIIYKVVNSFVKSWIAIVIAMMITKGLPDGILDPLKCLYAFLLGAAIYYAVEEGKEFIFITMSGFIAFIFYIHGIAYPYGDTFMIAVIILGVLKTRITLRNDFINSLVAFIDKHSYSIYLMQGLVVTIVSYCFGGMKPGLLSWGMVIITLVLAVLFDKIDSLISNRK